MNKKFFVFIICYLVNAWVTSIFALRLLAVWWHWVHQAMLVTHISGGELYGIVKDNGYAKRKGRGVKSTKLTHTRTRQNRKNRLPETGTWEEPFLQKIYLYSFEIFYKFVFIVAIAGAHFGSIGMLTLCWKIHPSNSRKTWVLVGRNSFIRYKDRHLYVWCSVWVTLHFSDGKSWEVPERKI